jgi:hypothetical protein
MNIVRMTWDELKIEPLCIVSSPNFEWFPKIHFFSKKNKNKNKNKIKAGNAEKADQERLQK